MVVKTEPCVYSEYRIYPGKGRKLVTKDGRTHFFITKKCRKLFLRKTKPVKLTWSQAWRRFNKKIKVDESLKRKTKKTTRVQKAIVGISLEEIKRKKAEKPEARDAALDATKKEVKERQKKKQEAKQVEKAKQKKAAAAAAPAKGKGAKGGAGGAGFKGGKR